MSINELRQDLSIRGKNGIAFLMSAIIIWLIFTIIFSMNLDIDTKNILLFMTTGAMFPLALLFSKIIHADWKMDDHPLGNLGLILNLAQFSYFPLAFWAFIYEPTIMIMAFAVITAAHFFPYGWFYDAKAYYVLAPLLSVLVMVFRSIDFPLWSISLTMVIGLVILVSSLFYNYKKKLNMEIEIDPTKSFTV